MSDNSGKNIDARNHELVKNLAPAPVFRFFADLSAIPRESGHTAALSDWLEAFARERKLEHSRDAVGNVIIKKPARHSQSAKGVILQGHQDMVCVKEPSSGHDFRKDPIEFKIEGEWLTANGTTLGGDDGIGVALALAVLDSESIPHPPLEALFTVDEETDMKGAKAIKAGQLKGETLINLDAEELNVAYISSAAGITADLRLPLERENAQAKGSYFRLSLDGLLGGHSGLEIQKGRANAYILLARFLEAAANELDYGLHSLDQGAGRGADNAIPDRAVAVLSLEDAAAEKKLAALVKTWAGIFKNEYRAADPGLRLGLARLEEGKAPAGLGGALRPDCRERLLALLRLLPLGVFRFIQTGILLETRYGELLVETSCNLGVVRLEADSALMSLMARGSTASVLDDLMARTLAAARLAGGSLEERNRIDGWEMPAKLTPVQELFSRQGLTCLGVHAGLECGCLVAEFLKDGRHLDAISVGPDLKDAHSPQERLRIASVETLWKQLLAVLEKLTR